MPAEQRVASDPASPRELSERYYKESFYENQHPEDQSLKMLRAIYFELRHQTKLIEGG